MSVERLFKVKQELVQNEFPKMQSNLFKKIKDFEFLKEEEKKFVYLNTVYAYAGMFLMHFADLTESPVDEIIDFIRNDMKEKDKEDVCH